MIRLADLIETQAWFKLNKREGRGARKRNLDELPCWVGESAQAFSPE